MAHLNEQQCESMVYHFFLFDGWLPPGTTAGTWKDVRMVEMGMDDPPLPDNPDAQRERIALDLQQLFMVLGDGVDSPLDRLKDGDETLAGLAAWCHENQH